MAAKTTTTPASFRIDRILGDRPFAEVGEPALTVRDENRGLLAVAGTRTAWPECRTSGSSPRSASTAWKT
ncbi:MULTISPECIES: hypothetical protein [Streptomyces]|uniref:Uncharacterized protein n=2 Tax=Streptomyces TaxID=1883 RepID=A0ABU4KFR1_9ACTN|nr:hypothetical protein [Streptomyces roseolus]MDX2296630.1 hypothetical protein [Streptomyces roseolus]